MSAGDAKLLFDECVGQPAIALVAQLVARGGGEKPRISHLFELAPPGTRDEVWIPQIASEGWTVITADGGRTPNKNRGQKLTHLCNFYEVTHIVLSPAVHGRVSFEKLLTILSVWYELLAIAADPARRGSRYSLEPVPSLQRGQGRLVLRRRSDSEAPPAPPVE